MKRLIAIVCLATSPLAFATPSESEKLLDKVITYPGTYQQVCNIMFAAQSVPYRAYQISTPKGAIFSKANRAAISANRAALVTAIRNRLTQIDFTRQPVFPGIDPSPEGNGNGSSDFGCDPLSLNPLLLELIVNQQAIEAMPELLKIEQRLVDGITRAENSDTAPIPLTQGWYIGMDWSNKSNKEISPEETKRRYELFLARVVQRDLLMVCQRLMREKKYAPALKTQVEAAYVKGLQEIAQAKKIPKLNPDEPLPPGTMRDPISGIIHYEDAEVLIPYSPESCEEIRAAAGQWINEHP